MILISSRQYTSRPPSQCRDLLLRQASSPQAPPGKAGSGTRDTACSRRKDNRRILPDTAIAEYAVSMRATIAPITQARHRSLAARSAPIAAAALRRIAPAGLAAYPLLADCRPS